MKKMIALFLAFAMVFSLSGCGDAVKPSKDSKRVDYTPDHFEYITFYYIPKGYSGLCEEDMSIDSSTGQPYQYKAATYRAGIIGDNNISIKLLYRCEDTVFYKDSYKNEYIRESKNGCWHIVQDVGVGPSGKLLPAVTLYPTDDNIIGSIKLYATSNFKQEISNYPETYEVLYEELLEFVDGISGSSLDREAFYIR